MEQATKALVRRLGVHRAQLSDIPQLLKQLQEFSKFAGGKRSFYPGDEMASTIVTNLITTQPFFVTRRDWEVTGFIAGIVAPHIFNPSIRILTELFWWVPEEYRGSRSGLLLLETLTEWARRNADMFVMTLEHNSPVKPETLEKRGFKLRERNYILDI